VATEGSVVEVTVITGVVTEVGVRLMVVTVGVCTSVGGLSVEATVDVPENDSIEDGAMKIVELGLSCDVCNEMGFVWEAIVEA